MNKRQKIFLTLIFLIILLTTLVIIFYSTQNNVENGKLKLVATFYPLTFFAKQIGREKVTVIQLIPDNMEVHNWQPSFADILALEEAEIIIYNGGPIDKWFEDDVLTIIDSSNKIIIETTKGIQPLEIKQNGHEKIHNKQYDPHTWISPVIAIEQAHCIYEALLKKDPSQAAYYTESWLDLKTKLEELDNNYINGLSIKVKEDIFVAHSAFGYLADRYNFQQHGVIGISADEQPSTSKYWDLVQMMIEHQIYVVYINPIYSREYVETLKIELERLSNQNVQILKLYFMLGEVDNLDYFKQHEKNLENLRIGLEAK